MEFGKKNSGKADRRTRDLENREASLDKEIEVLKAETTEKDRTISRLEKERAAEESDGFTPLFSTSSTGKAEAQSEGQCEAVSDKAAVEEQTPAEEPVELSRAMQEKIASLEEREKSIAAILTQLEKSYAQLTQREAALNKKEETLNREYLKILELESLYKGIDKLSNGLNSVLPTLTTGEINLKEAEAKLKEDK